MVSDCMNNTADRTWTASNPGTKSMLPFTQVQDMGIYCNYFDIVILILVNKKKADQSIGIKFDEIIYKKN